jgi:hypothetical protein
MSGGCEGNSNSRVHVSAGDVTHSVDHGGHHDAERDGYAHMCHLSVALGVHHDRPTSPEHQYECGDHLRRKLQSVAKPRGSTGCMRSWCQCHETQFECTNQAPKTKTKEKNLQAHMY